MGIDDGYGALATPPLPSCLFRGQQLVCPAHHPRWKGRTSYLAPSPVWLTIALPTPPAYLLFLCLDGGQEMPLE